MNKAIRIGGFLVTLLSVQGSAHAETQTLEQTLAQAYQSNPALQAERARLRAVDEQVSQALSGYRPSVDGVADIGAARQTVQGGSMAGAADLTPRSAGVTVTQPLFRGFRTSASVKAAEAQVMAQRARLLSAEQNLLLETSQAYLDVVLAQRVRELAVANEEMLRQQREATQSRFNVGEVTKTDISQAEARLNAAKAQRLQAEGDLAVRRATFARLAGDMPGTLAQPTLTLSDPRSVDDALDLAQRNNPALWAADRGEEAAQAEVSAAKGSLLPEVSLVGSAGRAWDQSLILPNRQDTSSVMARVTIPLYRSGADYARTRAAQQTVTQRRLERDDVRNRVREGALAAWQALATARASLSADQAAVQATELALRGVQEEAKVGTRTVLDVLNAQQERMGAQVNLARAEHDEALAILQLRAVTGTLTAEALRLPVEIYKPTTHYEESRGRWFGYDTVEEK